MGAGGGAGTIFKGGKGHQRLIAQRGRAEGSAAEGNGAPNQGVGQFDAGGTEAGGARFNFAAHLPSDEFKQFLVGIALIGAHVHHEATGIRHDVVLRARLNLGDTHLHRSEQVGLTREEVGAEPVDVGQCFVDGIDAFIAGGMSCFAVGGAVQDHQSFLCHSGLHLGGLSDDGDIHLRQAGQGFPAAALADDSDALALPDVEIDSLDRLDEALRAVENDLESTYSKTFGLHRAPPLSQRPSRRKPRLCSFHRALRRISPRRFS